MQIQGCCKETMLLQLMMRREKEPRQKGKKSFLAKRNYNTSSVQSTSCSYWNVEVLVFLCSMKSLESLLSRDLWGQLVSLSSSSSLPIAISSTLPLISSFYHDYVQQFIFLIFGPKQLVKRLILAIFLQGTVYSIQKMEQILHYCYSLCSSKVRRLTVDRVYTTRAGKLSP